MMYCSSSSYWLLLSSTTGGNVLSFPLHAGHVTPAVNLYVQLCFCVQRNLFPCFCRCHRDNYSPKNIHALFSKTHGHDILKKKVRLQLQVSWGLTVWAQPNTQALKHGNHFQQTSEEMSQRNEAEGCSERFKVWDGVGAVSQGMWVASATDIPYLIASTELGNADPQLYGT